MNAGRALVAVAVVAAAIGGAGGLASAAEADPAQEERKLLDADTITVSVDLRDDGSAEWAIQYKYRLDTPNQTRGFERLRERVGAREATYASDVRGDVEQTVNLAENDTGRSMAVANVSVDAHRQTIPQDFGVVVHRFTWDGFAATDGSALRAGDAIRGFWLRPRTELRFEWPAGYRATEVEPEPDETDDDGATWENPDFGVDEPSVVLHRESTSDWSDLAAPGLLVLTVVGTVALLRNREVLSTVPAIATPTALQRSERQAAGDAEASSRGLLDVSSLRRTDAHADRSDAAGDRTGVSLSPASGDGAVAADGAVAVDDEDSTGGDGSGPAAVGSAATTDSSGTAGDGGGSDGRGGDCEAQATTGAGSPHSDAEPASDRADASAGDEPVGDAAGEPTAPSVPLSNEERLLRVLDRNDGRVKQQTVAEVCDWSASKTSRVVGSLEEEGVVDVFRIGRENVVSSTEDDLEDV